MEPVTSKARDAFDVSIKDAVDLLEYHAKSGHPPPPHAEVLKRAGLVMALTAWETYVEDRLVEAVTHKLASSTSHSAMFMQDRLREELKRFHNPTSDKTRKLFQDYLDIDVVSEWKWQHVDPKKACEELDSLLKKRGDAVHRARGPQNGPSTPHLVTRDKLDKAIRFIKELVTATERAVSQVSVLE